MKTGIWFLPPCFYRAMLWKGWCSWRCSDSKQNASFLLLVFHLSESLVLIMVLLSHPCQQALVFEVTVFWSYGFFWRAIFCLWKWQGSITWWLWEREALAMWVSKFPFLLLTRQEPFEKIIQRKISFGNQNNQQKGFLFNVLETTCWLITLSALSSRHWMPGHLDPNSARQRETLQPLCPEARMPAPAWACWFSARHKDLSV